MRDKRNFARDERAEIMIHHGEGERVKIQNIARHMKRHDLPLAVLRPNVAADEAINEEATLGRAITVSDKVLMCRDALQGHGKAEDAVPVVVVQNSDALQLANKLAVFWMQTSGVAHRTALQSEAILTRPRSRVPRPDADMSSRTRLLF